MKVTERKNVAMKARLCFNCLNANHQVRFCKYSPYSKCGKRHNIQLHEDHSVSTNDQSKNNEGSSTEQEAVVAFTNSVSTNMNVMLATTSINVYNEFGKPYTCRAILDSGSQLNFITTNCAKRLGLKCSKNNLNITGIASMTSAVKSICQAIVVSRFGDHKYNLQLHTVPVLVNALPSQTFSYNHMSIPKSIRDYLADPKFHVPGSIDILLGADVLGNDKCTLSESAALHKTKFGWIVSGRLPFVSCNTTSSYLTVLNNSALSLFTSKTNTHQAEEHLAEEHFITNVKRCADGRFMVKLPLSQDPKVLGDSRRMAQKRFFNLEKRLVNDPLLSKQYKDFMDEYVLMGHMELAETHDTINTYYLPHHAVFKTESSTTKIRIVFDGSAVATSGLSLNSIMLKGPKVQPDIIQILWRFRMHQIAITSDVEKMYRQVLVAPEDRDLQRICYRSQADEPLKEYRLKTVTYGTKAASFLATRCLAQVAEDIHDTSLKRIITQDFYVDDLITGGKTDEECYNIYQQLQVT